MRIIITQAEIEEAISEKVLGQMSINEDMELKINLAATRGDEGYTATIDVQAKKVEEPLKAPVTRARKPAPVAAATTASANTAAAPATDETQAAQEQEEEGVTNQSADATTDSQEQEVSEEVPADKPTGSIFGNLRKPVNTPAAATE